MSDKGLRITGLAPGRPAWHRAPRLPVPVLLCFAAWAAAALLGSSVLCGGTSGECLADVGQGWLIGGVIVLGYVALLAALGLAERARERFGQRRAASLFYLTPLLAGITVGSGAGVAVALGPSWPEGARRALDGVPGTEAVLVSAVVAVVAAVWGLVVAAQLPAALRHARKRQETIERLRRDGHGMRASCGSARSGSGCTTIRSSIRCRARLRAGGAVLAVGVDPARDGTKNAPHLREQVRGDLSG